ncbi:hypothetical protein H0H92_000284 [Tricholoma furcatifolium]|nr:hypothetical protein H0H92_000284 [Tricholoma furcatifolium]
MSDNLLALVSPPASPTLRIDWKEDSTIGNVDIVDLPDAVDDYFQGSPIKRQRSYSSRPAKGRVKRFRLNSVEKTGARDPMSSVITPGSTLDATSRDFTADVSGDSTSVYYPPASPTPRALVSDWTTDGPEAFGSDLLAPSLLSLGDVNDAVRYPEFVEAALSACLGFYRLTSSVYLVQGWDSSTATATRRWYHLQSQRIGYELVNICLCPYEQLDCVHARFLDQFREEEFPDDDELPVELGAVQLVFRDTSEGRHLFSVETAGKHGIKPRAIVQHDGHVDGGGAWKCSKDGGQGCPHVHAARDYLQQLIYMNPAARDDRELMPANLGESPALRGFLATDMQTLDSQVRQASGVINNISSVSFKAIPPPVWAELPSDLPLPCPRPPPFTTPDPSAIPLENDARCACGAIQNTQTAIVVNTCRIYTILGCYDAEIEQRRCTQCSGGRHRFAGPDCCHLGLFNYNNRILFSHDLLDEYTMAYTSSETPFAAWVSIAARRYKVHQSQYPFVSETIFRAAWFGYARLLELDGDFKCSRCGPVPLEPIFDGVVVSFSKSRVLDSLCPPTTAHSDSLIRSSRLLKDKALISNAKLRKNLRMIVNGPAIVLRPNNEDEDDSDDVESEDEEAADSQRRRISLLPSVHSELSKVNTALGTLFQRLFMHNHVSIPLPYKRLFLQVRCHI